MSKRKKYEKKLVCQLCYACQENCKQLEPIEKCEFFKRGLTRHEYLNYIRQDNINVRKLCDKAGLSYNVMMRMLNGSLQFKYSYRYALDERVYEKQEYLPYIEKWDSGNFDDESSEGDVACGQIE